MPELRIAVLVDGDGVQAFGLRALDELGGCDEVSVFSCSNTRTTRRPFRHGFYYALNLLALRSRLTKRVPVARTKKRLAQTVQFESGYEGAWQTLPPGIVRKLCGFDVILKLGMGLLRVPPADVLPVPILSWHHGDPDRYRGRPAGFWEIVDGAPVMGQIVQVLSNKLDGGRVVAFAETKVHPHSYRATLREAYSHSHLLLNRAIRNAVAGDALAKSSAGKNYRLPSNLAVLAFVARMAWSFLKRLVYGALVEKAWCVSTAETSGDAISGIVTGGSFPPPGTWETLPTPRDYVFLADPFFSREPEGVLVEALSRRTAIGEIALVSRDGCRQLSHERFHLSYPATVQAGGEELVIPEMAQGGEQRCFRIRHGRLEDAGSIDVEGQPRLLDPTLIEHEGRFYLFGNDEEQGATALQLWSAEALRGPFRPHPSSPVRISPLGGRMAGALLRIGDRLIRFGQDFSGDYGDGVHAFEVETLNPAEYRERAIGTIRFGDRQGPHTINVDGKRIVFDWYHRRFSTLSGVRRAAARMRRRRGG
jgi:hypothetical protein